MNKFEILYADPPWKYKDKAQAGNRGAECKYPVLDLKALMELPVAEVMAPNSVAFIWGTWPLLDDVQQLMTSWGFRYKTCGFLWVKKNKKSTDTNFWGMGNWSRSNTEFCLLGVRGKPKRVARNIHQVIEHPIMKHSEKPAIVREKIVQLAGDKPRLELFTRHVVDGWTGLGNHLDSRDIRESLPELAASLNKN